MNKRKILNDPDIAVDIRDLRGHPFGVIINSFIELCCPKKNKKEYRTTLTLQVKMS